MDQAADGRFRVLGIPVDLVDLESALDRIEAWIRQNDGRLRYVVCAESRLVMECHRNVTLREAVQAADLIVPDGMPLVWLARLRGHSQPARVTAYDLLVGLSERCQRNGTSCFFYGGAPGVPERVAERLKGRFPGLKVAGTHSPPFRALTAEEAKEVHRMIVRARPDVLWVGLGCPKQEIWVRERVGQLSVPVAVTIGAAFDFCAGTVRRAPRWMQDHGLEWLYRLIQEPRRLWSRYLVLGPRFVVLSLAEVLAEKLRSVGFRRSRGRR
jgi:N-acetylglucosaminyldiphosphoundecaprenol N-acetyl-beta-D-mannosaminyltransferase